MRHLKEWQTLKYKAYNFKSADNMMLLAKGEETLQDVVDQLVKTGRNCEIKINVDKSKVMKISG